MDLVLRLPKIREAANLPLDRTANTATTLAASSTLVISLRDGWLGAKAGTKSRHTPVFPSLSLGNRRSKWVVSFSRSSFAYGWPGEKRSRLIPQLDCCRR